MLIGSSSGAKQILSQNESLFSMQRAMSHLAVAVATASEPSLKARHLEAVQMIFDQITVPGSEQKQNSSAAAPDWEEQLLHRWFRWLGEPFPKLLLQCVRDPISEVQMGALRVLMALLRHQWAYPHFCAVNGFIDLLVDRSVANFDADALQLKHALVCRVVDAASPSVNAGQMELLRDYRVKGPFWLTPRMEVATEGAG
uniref:FAT domain-containing protein n=1 Tax=Globodera pallida TaxID=36090 RepID=A0A183CLR2_GLOPA